MIINLQTNSDFFLWPIPKRKKIPRVRESQLKIEITHQLLFWRDVELKG